MKTKLIMLFSFILKTFSAFTQNTSAEPIPTLLETAWEEREDVIYKSFFKNAPEQIYTPRRIPVESQLGEKPWCCHARA